MFREDTKKGVHDDDFDVDAELKQPSFSKSGDLWQLGEHRLVCGDSTKAETYALLMNGKVANLVVTDPPYNVNYEGSAGKIKNDNMENSAFYQFLLDAYTQMHSAMAEDASIYIFHADTEGLNFRRAFADAGFYLSGTCIWKKQSLVLGRSPYQWQHEPVLFGWKKAGKHQWYTGRKETTISIKLMILKYCREKVVFCQLILERKKFRVYAESVQKGCSISKNRRCLYYICRRRSWFSAGNKHCTGLGFRTLRKMDEKNGKSLLLNERLFFYYCIY